MQNVLYIVSSILSAIVLIVYFWKAGRKFSDIDFGFFLQALIFWSILGAVFYIVIEFIFLPSA